MDHVYTWKGSPGGTNCYQGALNHARAVSHRSGKACLVIYHGKQTGQPRNKTADPRKVSFFVKPNGDLDFAKQCEGNFEWWVEPEGTKGITW